MMEGYQAIPLSERELLIRAREAAIACGALGTEAGGGSDIIETARKGRGDDYWAVKAAAQALRDLAKPLEEVRPPDPDETEAERLVRTVDLEGVVRPSQAKRIALAGIKLGRELEQKRQ